MKFICLGYIDESMFNGWTDQQQKKFVDDCFAYDDILRKNKHFAGGEALQVSTTAQTIRGRSGRVTVTDGPFAETKEQIGGIMILEANDLQHAVDLMSNHPSTLMGGTWEIRPSNEQMNDMIQQAGFPKT